MIYPKSPILRRAFLEIWFSFHSLNRYLFLRNKCDIISIRRNLKNIMFSEAEASYLFSKLLEIMY